MQCVTSQSVCTQVYVSRHNACPFGATASVQAWERIAAMVTFVARKLLGVLVYCYVDDFIGVDRWTLLHCVRMSMWQV